MASGFWEIPLVATAESVDFIVSLPNALFVLDPNNPVSGPKTGSASFTVGGTGEILLDGLPFTLLTLPAGFQITLITRVLNSGVEGPPNGGLSGQGWTSDTIEGAGLREIPTWDTDFGWNQASAPLNQAAQVAMLTGYTLNCDFLQENGGGFTWSIFGPDAPINTALDGTWDDLGAQVVPTPPVVETGPGPGEITVTPGANTVIVVVTVPGEPEIIVPVTPGVPTVITVPPGTPSVTPVNIPITTGPPVEPSTDPVVEGDLVIDVALISPMQFMRDPSGIYTLVPGQFYDVLYEHVAGTTVATSQTVAIPRPYGVTSYIPERDD